MSDFRRGDIVYNVFTTERNPTHYLLYFGKSTIRQGRYSHKAYDCLAYDGRKVQLFREPEPLAYVGHMAEFDAFMEALKNLDKSKETT